MQQPPTPERLRPRIVDDEAMEPHPATNFNAGVIKALSLLIVAGVLFATWRLSNPSTASAWYDNVDDAMVKAEETRKPILVHFTADWCPPCVQFKKNVLTVADIQETLAQKFVLVRIDLTQQGGKNGVIAQKLGVRSIPTFIMYDADGQHLETKTGGMDANYFQHWLSETTR